MISVSHFTHKPTPHQLICQSQAVSCLDYLWIFDICSADDLQPCYVYIHVQLHTYLGPKLEENCGQVMNRNKFYRHQWCCNEETGYLKQKCNCGFCTLVQFMKRSRYLHHWALSSNIAIWTVTHQYEKKFSLTFVTMQVSSVVLPVWDHLIQF